MKRGLTLLAAAMFLLGASFQAQATEILLTPGTATCGSPTCLALFGDDSSQAAIDAKIAVAFPGVSEIYKQNADDAFDTGGAGAWYTTTFNADLSGGTVTWDGPGFIVGTPIYFLVKDGSQSPNWFLFDISNWTGAPNGTKDTITFSGFFPSNGSISHVSIYGGSTSVPDGGSVAMLLGAALMGLAGFRRMLK